MKLALGTVQFGLSYGVANSSGQVRLPEIIEILNRARQAGIDTIDTAVLYGQSEMMLGEAGVSGLSVVSKLPPLDPTIDIATEVAGSLKRLGLQRLHGLLLHRSQDLAGGHASSIYSTLRSLTERGLVEKIGVSIYDPVELESIRFPIDLVQAPYNVLDRRLADSGWLARLKDRGVEVHTRSVFLQGILLMPKDRRPEKFSRWQSVLSAWDDWLIETQQSALSAALAFAAGNGMIDRVIVGVDSCTHLEQILHANGVAALEPPAHLFSNDPILINPQNWNAL